MKYEEAQIAATNAIFELAQDEEMHEQVKQVRAWLESMDISREDLIEFSRTCFLKTTLLSRPDIPEEEIANDVEAKLEVFMWLMDNV